MRRTELCRLYEPSEEAGGLIWQAFIRGRAFVASSAGLDIDIARAARQDPAAFAEVADLFAAHPCVNGADALSYVPNDMRHFTEAVAKRTGQQVIKMYRPPGAGRSAIEYVGRHHIRLTEGVGRVCLLAGVVTTGASIKWTRDRLLEENPDLTVHSLAMLYRGILSTHALEPQDHVFLRRFVPHDRGRFEQDFPQIPIEEVAIT